MMKRSLHIAIFLIALVQAATAQVTFRLVGGPVVTNNTVLVDVQVSGFSDIAALQYTMKYDTASLVFDGAQDFDLSGLSSASFNLPVEGTINLTWFSSPGETKPDGTVIYRLRFLASETKASKITFDKSQPIIVADGNGNEQDYRLFYGGINATYLDGQVIFDFNENCQSDAGESGLNDIPMKVEGPGLTSFFTTDSTGTFELELPEVPQVNVLTLPRISAWQLCTPVLPVNLINYSQNVIESLLQPAYGCPHMEVDVSTGFVKPCESLTYWVSYQNNGPGPAFGATIEVVLDSFMSFVSSSLPPIQLDGKRVVFNVGNVAPDQSGRFSIMVQNDCIGTVIGQAQCVTAHIYPDEICDPVSPVWDHSSVSVTGKCKGDSTEFVISNTGTGTMNALQDYIIIEDMILGKTGQVQLPPGGSLTLTEKTDNHTYRLIVNQSVGHPGRSYPTVALEGCDGYNANTMLGSVTEFAEDDADFFVSKDCQESTDSPIPNSIKGHPKGYGPDFYVTTHTDMTYLVYFKNETGDTVTSLQIIDTVSATLDIAKTQPESSSHPYDFSLAGDNLIVLDFPGISLLPGEDGFVKFRIPQNPNNPIDAELTNSATIVMDSTSLSTNEVVNKVGGETEQLYVMVDTDNPHFPDVDLTISPNPWVDETVIQVKGYTPTDLRLTLYKIDGSVLLEQSSTAGAFRLSRSNISGGVYVFVIRDGSVVLASGKIVAP